MSNLALAAIIIFGWPVTTVWALGLLVGINLITLGWAILMAALAGRNLAGDVGLPRRRHVTDPAADMAQESLAFA